MLKTVLASLLINCSISGQALATFSPEPNDPPRRTGGSGTRQDSQGTIVQDPKDCPKGTEVILANGDGTFTCFSGGSASLIEPPPESPAPRTTVSGGGNA